MFHYDYFDELGTTKRSLKEMVNIDKSCFILPNEAYVDTWTIILHSLYIANRIKKNSLRTFRFILTNEIYFCLYQAGKIIKHFGFAGFHELFEKNVNKRIKQKTSVFSYYIIKSSLLFNLDKFLDFTKDFDFINFDETNQNFIKFNALIISCLTDKNFQKEVNRIIPFVQNTNLRMSLFEYL